MKSHVVKEAAVPTPTSDARLDSLSSHELKWISVVSKDGKIRTVTEKGVNAKGVKISNTLVYDRQ